MADTRIYRVDEKGEHGKTVASFLIRASSSAQAVRHVAQRFTCEVATPDDAFELGVAGIKVQTASGDASK